MKRILLGVACAALLAAPAQANGKKFEFQMAECVMKSVVILQGKKNPSVGEVLDMCKHQLRRHIAWQAYKYDTSVKVAKNMTQMYWMGYAKAMYIALSP